MVVRVNLWFGAVQYNNCEIRNCSKRASARDEVGTQTDTRVRARQLSQFGTVGDWGVVFSPWTKIFKGDESTAEHATAIDSNYAYPKLLQVTVSRLVSCVSRGCDDQE